MLTTPYRPKGTMIISGRGGPKKCGGRVKEIIDPLIGGERKQASSDRGQLSVVAKASLYYSKGDIFLVKIVGTIYHLPQINKVFILSKSFNQHFYNIFRFRWIS